MKHFILIALVFAATTMSAQKDSVMVEIAADTLSSDMQEGGISVEALNLYNQGLTYADRDMPDSAVVYFTLALDSNPDFGKALYNRSSAYLKMENYPSALIDIDRYLEVVDTASFGYYTRAAILEELNRDDDAISAYQQAIDRGDKVEESQRSLAKIFLEREEFQKAVDHFTAYLRYDPSNAFALHDRATAYLLLNDLTAAERDYRQAAMVNNEFASASSL